MRGNHERILLPTIPKSEFSPVRIVAAAYTCMEATHKLPDSHRPYTDAAYKINPYT